MPEILKSNFWKKFCSFSPSSILIITGFHPIRGIITFQTLLRLNSKISNSETLPSDQNLFSVQQKVSLLLNLLHTHRDLSKQSWRDFLGDSVVKDLPCSAGDTGLIPGQGTNIPHATRKLNFSALLGSLAVLELCSTAREALAIRSPCATTRE